MYPTGRHWCHIERIVRGRLGIVFTVTIFSVATAIEGRSGLALAASWVLVSGAYCLGNFWRCRETHCVVTGTGWSALALLGLAAAFAPGGGLGWLRADVLVPTYLAVLGAGFCFEAVVAARTGSRALGVGRDGAEAR